MAKWTVEISKCFLKQSGIKPPARIVSFSMKRLKRLMRQVLEEAKEKDDQDEYEKLVKNPDLVFEKARQLML